MKIVFSSKQPPTPWVIVLIWMTLGLPATATPTAGDGPEACSSEAPPEPCSKRPDMPFIRIAFLQTGMQAVAGALWPEAYNPITVRKNARQLAASWSAPPEHRFDEPFFGSDGDWWYFNVFAHGLYGSEAYLAGRVWGHGPLISTAYALLASFTWEYLIESWYKPPSAIDLIWTPMAGVLLGELRYRLLLAAHRRIRNRVLRVTVRILLDPIGEMERLTVGCPLRR